MTEQTYSKGAITLHWVIAAMIVAQLATALIIGFESVQNLLGLEKQAVYSIYPFHKSLGLTILVASVLRLVWRLMHRPPAYPADLKSWEVKTAKLTHALLYVVMIGVPFTGWLLVSTSSRGMPTLWFDQFVWPNLPLSGLSFKGDINDASRFLHVYLGYSMFGLLFLHVGAALKHHFIDRNTVLHRMIPLIRPRQK